MSIKITADSTCDLLDIQLKRYDITLMPLYVNLGDRCLRDVVEATPEDIYAYVDSGKGMCSTSAGNIGDYTDLFEKYAGVSRAVIHISLSSELSSSYQNAVLAAQEFENVYVVDSRNLSTGQGLVVLRAASLAEEGKDADEIIEELKSFVPKVDASFVLNQLEYLHRGGRCSGVVALGANLLKLKPCIEVKNGGMDVGKKYRGALAKCVESYVRDRLVDGGEIDPAVAFVTHSGLDEETVELARKTVEACADFREVVVTRAGCTISSHCGPGTLGVLFARK